MNASYRLNTCKSRGNDIGSLLPIGVDRRTGDHVGSGIVDVVVDPLAVVNGLVGDAVVQAELLELTFAGLDAGETFPLVGGEDGSFVIDSSCNGGIIKVTSVGIPIHHR